MIEVYDKDGNLIVGGSSSLFTILGQVTTTKSNGSVTNPLLALGNPTIFSVLPAETASNYRVPVFAINGTTISWTFQNSGSQFNTPVRMIYGVT